MKDNGVHELALLKQKIQICGEQLRAWGSSKANPNNEEIKKLQNRMERLNMEEITEDSKVEFLGVSKALDDLLLKQEIFWEQRSRISWLKHGNKNTKFFHLKATQRRRRNYIHGVKNSDGVWVEEVDDIAEVATSYFENLFNAGTCA